MNNKMNILNKGLLDETRSEYGNSLIAVTISWSYENKSIKQKIVSNCFDN